MKEADRFSTNAENGTESEMTTDKAIKIAIEVITGKRKSLRHWQVDANIAAMLIEQNLTPHMRNAVKQVNELNQAIAALEAIQAQGRLW